VKGVNPLAAPIRSRTARIRQIGDGGNVPGGQAFVSVGLLVSIGVTVSLFFATAVFSDGTALAETPVEAT
jgi:hypothetical protein